MACQHHWIIESPNGPVAPAICKNCGAEREFGNSFMYESSREEKQFKTHKMSLMVDPQYYPRGRRTWGSRLA